MYTAVENNPILIDLVAESKTTGWSISADIATHVSCNQGNILLQAYPITAGKTYKVSYAILSISGGILRLFAGTSNGASRTTTGLFVETITASGTGDLGFFSDANCQVQNLNIQDITQTSAATGTTIVYSAENNNWSDFRTFYPDFGLSLYTQTLLFNGGAMWVADNGETTGTTNNFFGVQYQSTIQGVEAHNPTTIKDFETINYQANQLLVSTIGGIVSSLGQQTTLIDTDFIKQKLQSNGVTVITYDKDSVYSASLLNDENEDVVNGSTLRGNYVIWKLTTVDGSKPLRLFSVGVESKRVFLGAR